MDTTLFKNKILDSYTVTTNSNLETCLKLGMFRVCNVRKTKFRIANPFVVPVDIGHGRLLVITNSTILNSTAKSICNGAAKTLQIKPMVIVKVSQKCSIVGKTFEISRDHVEVCVNQTVPIDIIDNISIRAIQFHSQNKEQLHDEVENLPKLSNDFEVNNNKTVDSLNQIDVTFSQTETLLIASSSTSITLIVCIAVLLIVIRCSNKCKGDRKSQEKVVVVVDKAERPSQQVYNEVQTDDSESKECDLNTEMPNNTECDKVPNTHESKRPIFQHKR